jgi:hypothetical protein
VQTLEKTVQNICFIIIISFFALNIKSLTETRLYPLVTPQGKLFVRDVFKSHNDFIHYIAANTPEDAVIVAAPEGAIINFLAQRDSHNLYYYLIPPNVETFGEEKIIEDFKKNPPDYFILNNVPYSPFDRGIFCDYAPKICGYIESEYIPVAATPDKVIFTLFKRK